MKNLAKVFSALALALGMFFITPTTQAQAVITAPALSYFEIGGMSEQPWDGYKMFQDNKVETDGTIYVKVQQMGYGNTSIKVNGASRNFQETNREAITEISPKQGKIVVGWNITYKIDNLPKGINNIEFMCIGTSSSRVMRDTATILKL
ncbi:DUF4879 domain-containing protein [Clostridium gasigenes]|uniref:DUF4879 domain-containing protein n=1 Tax=Clostridium gasigenes TaxID=94869 RepID=UPI00162683C8|nr:DUF4879 domain-containing protein [Clostridium gasigenes]MBB6624393.1 DUF4879 domain-containing protein [Clostridium gasigenes]MBU3088712.1 YolA family protein [Clostridium gasigenes]